MTDNTLEAVARAMWDANLPYSKTCSWDHGKGPTHLTGEGKDEWRRIAHAAIETLRDNVSEEMMEAGDAAIVEGMVRAKSGQPPKHPTHASHEIIEAMLTASMGEK